MKINSKRAICTLAKLHGNKVRVAGYWCGDFEGKVLEVWETFAVIQRGEDRQDVLYEFATFTEVEKSK